MKHIQRRINTPPEVKLAIGESLIVPRKKPGELSQVHKNGKYHGMKFTAERVSEGSKITRIA